MTKKIRTLKEREEIKILKKFESKTVKAIEKPFAIKHLLTKKTLKYITLNLTVNEQVIPNRLYQKGYLGGSNIIHKLKLTKKGLEAIK